MANTAQTRKDLFAPQGVPPGREQPETVLPDTPPSVCLPRTMAFETSHQHGYPNAVKSNFFCSKLELIFRKQGKQHLSFLIWKTRRVRLNNFYGSFEFYML